MNNLINYLKWRGDLGFDISPLNEVDALIFSELVYLDFSGYTEKSQLPLSDINKLYFKEKRDVVFKDYYVFKDFYNTVGKEITKLLSESAKSNRLKNINVSDFAAYDCEDNPMQFGACTFHFDTDKLFIAYRGTDNTLNGWKEDCMIAITDNIPSQLNAAAYLSMVANKYPNSEIYLGGHSKGGNLAIYSAVNTFPEIKDRIIAVYNNDGPGFSKEFIESKQHKEIADRITTFVPQSSFVGMLLEHDEDYIIVKSASHSFWQHNAFSWNVVGTHFVHLDEDTKSIKFAEKNMKELIDGLTTEQKKQIIDSVFQIMAEGGKITFDDIRKAGIKNIPTMIKAFNKIDNESKKALTDGIALLAKLSIKNGYEINKPEPKGKLKKKGLV